MTNRSLHIPPELRARDDSPEFLRRAVQKWKDRLPKEPALSPSRLKVSGFGPQHEYHHIRARLPPVKSPHGLLFRTEDNLSFAVKVFSRWARLDPFSPSETDIRSLEYYSVKNSSNGSSWTPTLPRLSFTLAGYGAGWEGHFATESTDSKILSFLGLELERRRVLLLALSPTRNPLFRGVDLDELVVRDPMNLGRVFVLNDRPDLVRRILDIENGFWPVPGETMDRVMERFERLDRADGPADRFPRRG